VGLSHTRAEEPGPAKIAEKTPLAAPDHDIITRHGFTIYIEKRISILPRSEYRALTETLARDLERDVAAFPVEKRKILQETPIWVDWDNTGHPALRNFDFQSRLAFYMPLRSEIGEFGKTRRGGIVLSAYYCFEKKVTLLYFDQYYEGWLVHELSHSYHDRVLGFEKESVKLAFKSAKDRGLYGLVDTKFPSDQPGKPIIQKAYSYAGTNHDEYFAELSTSYLANRSSYPYNRADLKKYDPVGYALMVEVWGEKKD
jgi:hypothetical protein